MENGVTMTDPASVFLSWDTSFGEDVTIAPNVVFGPGVRVARGVETGVLSVNSSRSVFVEAPFGGFKESGLGRELGMAALEAYGEVKSVYLSAE